MGQEYHEKVFPVHIASILNDGLVDAGSSLGSRCKCETVLTEAKCLREREREREERTHEPKLKM
jgi:hypothetical protein